MCPEKFQIFFIAYSCKKQCIQSKSFKYSLFLIVGKSSVSIKVSNILYCLQLEKKCIQKSFKYSLMLIVVKSIVPENIQVFFIACSCKSSVSRKVSNILYCLQLLKVVYPETFQIFYVDCKKQCIQKGFKYSLLLVVVKSSVSSWKSFKQIFIAYSCKKQCIQKSSKYSLLLVVVKSSVSRKVSNALYCLQLEKVMYPENFQIFFIACSCKKQCIQKSFKYSLLLIVVKSSVSRKVSNILYCLQL